MDDYLKKIKIKFEADRDSYKNLEEDLKKLEKSFDIKSFENLSKTGLLSNQQVENLRKQISYLDDLEKQIETYSKQVEILSRLNDESAKEAVKVIEDKLKGLVKLKDSLLDEKKAQSFTSDFKEKVADWFLDKLQNLGSAFIDYLGTSLKEAWTELNEILSYSYLTNSSIREQAFSYGLSSAQNYAFSKTKQLLGISSDEDLFYMKDDQRKKFQEKFIEYSNKYTELYDEGFFEKLQDYNWEMQEFKEDLQYEFIDFFVNNKDTIMAGFEGLISLSEVAIEALSIIVSILGKDRDRTPYQREQDLQNIINKYRTTSVKIDNSFTNINQEDKRWLIQAGALTYEQFVLALNKGEL